MLFLNVGLSIGIFNNNGVHNALNETNLYENIYSDVYMRVQELLSNYDMPSEVFDDAINQKRINLGCNSYVNKTLLGETPQLTSDKLKSELYDSLNHYYETLDTQPDEDVIASAQALIYEVEQIYSNSVRLQFIDSIMELRAKYTRVLKYIYPLLIILIAGACICLLTLYRRRHRGLRFINYALLSASILLVSISIVFIIVIRNEWGYVVPDYYRNFIITYSRLSLQACLYTGVIGLILSAIVISLTGYIKYHYYNK